MSNASTVVDRTDDEESVEETGDIDASPSTLFGTYAGEKGAWSAPEFFAGTYVHNITGGSNEFKTNVSLIHPSPPSIKADPPPLATHFVGRDNILEEIGTKLKSGNFLSLTGSALIGYVQYTISAIPAHNTTLKANQMSPRKTQIARKFYAKFEAENPGSRAFWADLDDSTSCTKSFRAIGGELGIPGLNGPKVDPLPFIFDHLGKKESGKWLLVLNNVDNTGVLKAAWQGLPISRGRILTTSQTPNLPTLLLNAAKGDNSQVFPEEIVVRALDPPFAKLLFKAKVGEVIDVTDRQIDEIVKLHSYHPFAIAQAAAYLKQSKAAIKILKRGTNPTYLNQAVNPALQDIKDITADDAAFVAEYIKGIREDDTKFADSLANEFSDQDTITSHSLCSALGLTFTRISKRLKREDVEWVKLFGQMRYVYPQEIPEALLLTQGSDRYRWQIALATLSEHMLLESGPKYGTYSMPRLVKAAVTKWLDQDEQKSLKYDGYVRAVEMCVASFSLGEFEQWEKCEALSPHAKLILEPLDSKDFEHSLRLDTRRQLGDLLFRLAWYEWRLGRYDEAARHSESAYETRKHVFGENHSETLQSLTLKARILHHCGKHRQAKEALEKVINQNTPERMENLHYLAMTLARLQELDKAKLRLEQVLEWRRLPQNGGPDGIDTLVTESDLATVLCRMEQVEKAEPFFQKVLVSLSALLGENHPVTLTVNVHFAEVFEAKGNFDKAEELLRECKKLYEEYLERQGAKSDPDFLICLNSLGGVLVRQGEELSHRGNALPSLEKFKEAEDILSRVVDDYENGVGGDGKDKNEERVKSMLNLAVAREKIPGKEKDLRKLLSHMSTIATTFKVEGQLDAAEFLHKCTLDLRLRNLPFRDPDIQDSWSKVYALSDTYLAENQRSQARILRVKWYIIRCIYELYVSVYLVISAISRLMLGTEVRGLAGGEQRRTGEDAGVQLRPL
ncbi:hypothetical protein B0J11DRAFT_597884 [Dendryphion nanum]|uniref:Uncharacterized protein n=1 Tax=Dendryphion nanum TaxID=256645 RepID=A0A9P9D4E2_9PLEO|nr:hypothetical protein B0J11DRAFT_597884 [Dendryphion nanum]